ncbi:MAG: TerB family tellurite resistance protein [Proteobacteria bacterium]|nr:TerB family tellurite resistance protein [Pseudomonadota bacterium]
MLKSIERFFNKRIKSTDTVTGKEATDHSLMLATAALLIEISRADNVISLEETDLITRVIRKTFSLSDDETDELISLAEQQVEEAVSFYQFTHLINKGFSYERKLHVVGLLWQVVFADEEMEKHEEYFVRKIADLLHISHRDLIEAKHKAKNGK